MQIKNSVFYKVFIGPFDSYNKAKRYIQSINLKKLKRNNVEYSILRYNKQYIRSYEKLKCKTIVIEF